MAVIYCFYMEITVLVIQIALGLVFLMVGVMKVFMTDRALSKMVVLRNYDRGFVKLVGFAEIAGALGITLPIWLNILPILAPLAALGLSVVMLGALYVHVPRKEYPQAITALIFLVALLYFSWVFIA